MTKAKIQNKKEGLKFSTISLANTMVEYPRCDRYGNFVYYGDRNDFPQQIINLNLSSALNMSLIRQKVNFALGNGIDDSTYIGRPNLQDDWDTFLYKLFYDYVMFGGFSFQIIQNLDNKSVSLYHQDFSTVRIGLYDEFSNPLTYYISKDWSRATNGGRLAPVQLKAYGTETLKQGERYLYYYTDYQPNQEFYTVPNYFSAWNWIESDGMISEFYKNSIKKGFVPSVIVTVPSNPTDEEKEAFQSNIEKNFAGSKGAGSILVIYGMDGDNEVKVSKFEASENVKIFDNLENIIFQRIISAHRLSSPTLAGLQSSNGLSNNKDEMAAAFILYNRTVVAEIRRKIIDSLQPFIIMNGYTEKLQIKDLPIIDDLMNLNATVTTDVAQNDTNNNDGVTK